MTSAEPNAHFHPVLGMVPDEPKPDVSFHPVHGHGEQS